MEFDNIHQMAVVVIYIKIYLQPTGEMTLMTLNIVESGQMAMRFLTVSAAHCKGYFVFVECELR